MENSLFPGSQKFRDLEENHYAKSDGTTIAQHNRDLLKQLDHFLLVYPDLLDEKSQKLLQTAIQFHDYGKFSKYFQCKIQKKMDQKKFKCRGFINDDIVPHQFLSPLFLIWEWMQNQKSNLQDPDLITLLYSIIFHHARGTKYLKSLSGIRNLEREIKENFDDFFAHLKGLNYHFHNVDQLIKIYANFLLKILKHYTNANGNTFRETLREKNSDIIPMILIAGLLIRLDHAASASDLIVEETPIQEDREKIFLNYLQKKGLPPYLRKFQEKYCQYENAAIVADTGMGKTGLAVLWSKRKMFYVLPNRTSTNAMYETLKQIYGYEKVGLLHSNSLLYIFDQTKNGGKMNIDEDLQLLKHYESTRLLAKPVTVTTADQLFTAVFKYPTFQKIYATLAYSDVVIDEIQSYEPEQIVPILRQIEETVQIGTRYLIITATLPTLIKEKLENIGIPVFTEDPKTMDIIERHFIEILPDSIETQIDHIVQKAEEGRKVLVIANTVRKSQELYVALKQHFPNTHLLHSRFTLKTRRAKEHRIKSDLQKPAPVIWIATQIVEVSLDVDFDTLFTEAAPIDSLIQRMGRIYRHRTTPYNENLPNVFICENVDSRRDVYEPTMRNKTIEILKADIGTQGMLTTQQKRLIVEKFYSYENLKDTNYFKNWETLEKILESPWNFLYKGEAHDQFRNLMTIEIIPEKYQSHIEQYIDQLDKISQINDPLQRRIERIKVLNEIQNYKVPIPSYWIFGQQFAGARRYFVLNPDYDILILRASFADYNDELGLVPKTGEQEDHIGEAVFIE